MLTCIICNNSEICNIILSKLYTLGYSKGWRDGLIRDSEPHNLLLIDSINKSVIDGYVLYCSKNVLKGKLIIDLRSTKC